MIDEETLKLLGWSDDLIREVTRLAVPLRDIGGRIGSVEELSSHLSAGNQIYVSSPPISSSQTLTLQRND